MIIHHAFTLSSKFCILNFQLEKFDPSSLPNLWRYDSILLFISIQLNTSISHHRASLIYCHRIDQELQCATTGKIRSATTKQIKNNSNAPPLGKSNLLPPNRLKISNSPPSGRSDLLPPSESKNPNSPPLGRFDLLPPSGSKNPNSPPPSRSDLLSPSGSKNPNSPPPDKSDLLPPRRNFHVPPPGKIDLQKIADFFKEKEVGASFQSKALLTS